MMPASNKGAGGSLAFPDVCLTPAPPAPAPVPIPYPNLGMTAMSAPFSPNVRISMVNAINTASKISMTSGDEPGLAHPTFKGGVTFTLGNLIVYINLLPGVNLTSLLASNNMNAPLGAVIVPSITNVFFTHRGGAVAPGRALDASALEELALRSSEVEARLLGESLGYVRAPVFSAETPTRVARATTRLAREGMRALVLDLRDNPGGDADAFIRLAEDFLPRGSVVSRRVDVDGDEIVQRARHDGDTELPLFVLVNRWTASAAELFAGCLQWHGRATLIGERTYGKGRGRKVGATRDGAFEVDAATFTLPGGEPIDGVGLSPDVEAPGERGADVERDPAVLTALARATSAIEAR